MSDTEDLTHEELKRKTWPGQSGFGANPRTLMSMAIPLMAMMQSDDTPFGEAIIAKERSRELKKCVLPGCDVMFLPEKDSQCCCTKEHFFELRKLQKERK